MDIRLDYSNVLSSAIGNEHGLDPEKLRSMAAASGAHYESLMEKRNNGTLGFFDLPRDEVLLKEVIKYTTSVKERFESYVHIGIGGSSLGPIALHTSLNSAYYNMDRQPAMFFPDNVDPDWLDEILPHINVKKTLFHVVSKSGGTAETASTLLYFMEHLKKALGENFYRNLLFTTDPHAGLLNQIANENPIKCFRIPQNVGGRFSVFTALGLIPAALSGIDIAALMRGARKMDALTGREDLFDNPAFMYALIHTEMMKRGKNISVMMPYSNKLRDVADWYRQLWAESLGKRFDRNGKRVDVGQTPVKALGATDQHSQVQLYVEGPNDKITTFLEVGHFKHNTPLENHFPYIADFDYLAGKSLGQLLNTEKSATELALTNNRRPNLTLKLEKVDAEHVGGLLYLLEVATAYAGELLNINAFDQPGVEEGKIATYALMGRKGYEKKKAEIEKALQARPVHVIK